MPKDDEYYKQGLKIIGFIILLIFAYIGFSSIVDKSCWVGRGASKEWICDTR